MADTTTGSGLPRPLRGLDKKLWQRHGHNHGNNRTQLPNLLCSRVERKDDGRETERTAARAQAIESRARVGVTSVENLAILHDYAPTLPREEARRQEKDSSSRVMPTTVDERDTTKVMDGNMEACML